MALQIVKKEYENFLKNVSYLTIGRAFRILFNTLTFTFIVRSLEIAQYGQFITIITYCSFFEILTLPGMGKAVYRSAVRDPDNLDKILSSKIKLRYLLVAFAIVFANIAVKFFDYNNTIIDLVRVFSLSIIFTNLMVYFRYVFRVREDFKWISASDVLLSFSYMVLAILSLKYTVGINALIYSNLISMLLAFLYDYYNTRRFVTISFFGKLEFDNVFIKSTIIFSITNVIWQIIAKIDVLMLSVISTDTDVAIFNVGKQVITFAVIGISIISSVIYPPLVRKLYKGTIDFNRNKNKFLIGLVVCSIISILLFILSEFIIQIMAGNKYSESVIIVKIFTLFFFLQTIISPIQIILNAKDREYSLFLTALPLPIIKIGLNFLLFNYIGIQGIAYSTVAVYAVYLILLLLFNRKVLRKALNLTVKPGNNNN